MWLPFFKKQKTPSTPPDYSFLHTDMHAHFLPGLDDGAPDLDTSLELIDRLQRMGYRKLIASPHISMEFYPNTRERINEALKKTQEAVLAKGWDIQLAAAAEYMIDDHFIELLDSNQPLLSFGDNMVLIEMGYIAAHPMLKDVIFKLQSLGYKPVLAHPERYYFYHGMPQEIKSIADTGCKLQLNILALSGYYGSPVKKQAEWLLQHSLYSFAGTDLHHNRHADSLHNLDQSPFTLLQKCSFENSNL